MDKKLLKNSLIGLLASTVISYSALADDTEKMTDAAISLVEKGISKVLTNANDEIPDWIKRIEFEWKGQNEQRPTFSLLTVQPLYQSDDKANTIFTQLRAARVHKFNDVRTTYNAGLGYRHLFLDNKLLAGVNTFYDHEWNYHHGRVGAGVELRWGGFDLYANNYWTVTEEHQTEVIGVTEKGLSGRDLELTSQIPYMPWARLRVKHYGWDADSGNDEIRGWVGSGEFDLTQNLQVESGIIDDNTIDNEWFVNVRYRLGFGDDESLATNRKLIDNKAFHMRDMSNYTLSKVRRTNDIVVERRSGGITISRTN